MGCIKRLFDVCVYLATVLLFLSVVVAVSWLIVWGGGNAVEAACDRLVVSSCHDRTEDNFWRWIGEDL